MANDRKPRQNQFKEKQNLWVPITKTSRNRTRTSSRRNRTEQVTDTMSSAQSVPLVVLTQRSLCWLYFQKASPVVMSERLQQIWPHSQVQPRPAGKHNLLLPSSPQKSLIESFCCYWVTSLFLKESLPSKQSYALTGQAWSLGYNNPGCC